MPFCFLTLFDHRYLTRGWAMFESLKRHCPDSHLWVLALSPECALELNRRDDPQLTVIPLSTLEGAQPELLQAKANRSAKEYYYTLSSASCYYLLTSVPGVDLLTYLDADTYLFSSPAEVFESLASSSIGITPHNFSRWRKGQERFGKFNVGWVTFRRDVAGMECLEWWYRQCLDWCFERIETNRYADQKYLDVWPSKFKSVKIIDNPGVNAGPWNLGAYHRTMRDGAVYLNGQRLVLFHFADLTEVLPGVINTQLAGCGVFSGPVIRWRIYRPYIEHLMSLSRTSLQRGLGPQILPSVIGGVRLKHLVRTALGVMLMQYLLYCRGKVI